MGHCHTCCSYYYSGPWRLLLDIDRDIAFEQLDTIGKGFQRRTSAVAAAAAQLRAARTKRGSQATMSIGATLGSFAPASLSLQLGAKLSASQSALGEEMVTHREAMGVPDFARAF